MQALYQYKVITIFPNPTSLFSSRSPHFILSCPQGASSPTPTSRLPSNTAYPANTDLSSAKRHLWSSWPGLCHIPTHSLSFPRIVVDHCLLAPYRRMGPWTGIRINNLILHIREGRSKESLKSFLSWAVNPVRPTRSQFLFDSSLHLVKQK